MSTRCMIHVVDKGFNGEHITASWYKHHDGYPSGVGQTLSDFFAHASANKESLNSPQSLIKKLAVYLDNTAPSEDTESLFEREGCGYPNTVYQDTKDTGTLKDETVKALQGGERGHGDIDYAYTLTIKAGVPEIVCYHRDSYDFAPGYFWREKFRGSIEDFRAEFKLEISSDALLPNCPLPKTSVVDAETVFAVDFDFNEWCSSLGREGTTSDKLLFDLCVAKHRVLDDWCVKNNVSIEDIYYGPEKDDECNTAKPC